jgi:serine/threonine-protein kinase
VTDKPDTDPLADTAAPGAGVKKRAVQAGDVVGRYELVEEVGEGGMATVYRARDRELRRDVAVKVLFAHLAKRPDIVRRFHREARAAAALDHPNILRIYDVGGAEGEDPPYIVMELIRGHSLLGEIEQRGPMLAEAAACVGALLADALAAAHAAGVIHRDMKPANVMIAPGGRVLLTDFGVARLETQDSLVTKTGALLGTPAYMSPEQATGDTATTKSDLYSLGATLYQLACGVLPYSGSPAKVLAQIAQNALVPAVKRRATVGPDLSRAIDAMMQADSAARPASAYAIATELRAVASAGGLGDPAKELAEYFGDPEVFVKARTPAILASVITSAERAIGEGKLPRALALADRATALAPDDPSVATLVAKVTEGGRAARRRRVLAIAGAGVLAAGGATLAVMKLGGASDSPPDTAIIVAAAADARLIDSAVAVDAEIVDAPLPPPVDAPRGRVDAGLARRLDAQIQPLALDAAAIIAPDAAPQVVPPDAREVGAIIVKADAWCDVFIDGARVGRRSDAPLKVDAGKHTVTCEQPGTDRKWTKTIDVAPGKTATATGNLLGTVAVRLDVDATIEGVHHKRGETVQLKVGRHQVHAAGTDKWLDLREPCTLRGSDGADLDCFP